MMLSLPLSGNFRSVKFALTAAVLGTAVSTSLVHQKTYAASDTKQVATTPITAKLVKKNKREDREPEAATGREAKTAVLGKEYMVAAANPYASQAGYNILQRGGSAIDAAIAVQLVLTLVEPQSSGIGGGAFILHWDQQKQKLTSFDGRETAPQKVTDKLFLDQNGKAIPWIKAVVGGRSVGVPGVLAGLKMAHEQHGNLPWSELFVDAIELAEQGFIVSPRMAKLVALKFNPGVAQLAPLKGYLFPQGEPIKAGTLLKNPQLAKVYRSLAKDGIKPFYQGWIAKRMVDAVAKSAVAPGLLSLSDLANYQPVERPALCGDYRQYRVCGMAPPSSGGVAVIQILKQLEQFTMSDYAPNSLMAAHLFSQSSRLAFADRARYLADSDFVSVPSQGLIAHDYTQMRSQLINRSRDMGQATAGQPDNALAYADEQNYDLPSTSHISIVDGEGNAISMTTSIEMAFGSAVMVEGFILNNQLTDFALAPTRDGKPVANRIEPNKRPRSSMAPTMVFNRDGSLKLVVGAPGGSRIINYVAQTVIGVLDWQLDAQEAINLPKVTNRNRYTTLEKGTSIAALEPELVAMGHKVQVRDLNSGLHAIEVRHLSNDASGQKTNDKANTNNGANISANKANKLLIGGADPRREGQVLAQ